MINEIHIKNIRGFKGLNKVKVKRLTILVGENSSGKTTFLGAYNALAQLLYEKSMDADYNPFNKRPFDFGAFSNISYKKSKEFLLGGSVSIKKEKLDVQYTFNSKSSKLDDLQALPTEKSVKIEFNSGDLGKVLVNIEKESDGSIWKVIGNNHHFKFKSNIISQKEISSWLSQSVATNNLPYQGAPDVLKRYQSNVSNKDMESFNKIVRFLREIPFLEEGINVESLPPVHPEPNRYYKFNPVDRSENLLEFTKVLGEKIDLFEDIKTVKIGDFYQLLVKTSIFDCYFNIKDVGYGVSSILPFLQTISASRNDGSVFLLQQPENHLHPSAQAEMMQLLAKSKHHFLIETHSDYLLKRLCICVMKKVIKLDEMKILYFEKGKDELKIHEIDMDEDGNLINPPKNYRSFFLKERDEFLGF